MSQHYIVPLSGYSVVAGYCCKRAYIVGVAEFVVGFVPELEFVVVAI